MTISHKRQQVPIVSLVERRTKGRKMSLAAYMNWKPEDGHKYEWNDGVLEKSEYMMTQWEFSILRNLRQVLLTQDPTLRNGDFYAEGKMPTSPTRVRISDIAYYSNEQVSLAATGKSIVAAWVIEIASEHDTIKGKEQKLLEYFQAGVQVVWYILPTSRRVEVFTSPDNSVRHSGVSRCSAAPAMSDFSITVDELFASTFP